MAESTAGVDDGGDDTLFTNKDKRIEWATILELKESKILDRIIEADKLGNEDLLGQLLEQLEGRAGFVFLASLKVDPEDGNASADSLCFLFRLTQAVMEIESSKFTESSRKWKEKIKQLKGENETLKEEILKQDDELSKLQADLIARSSNPKSGGGSDLGVADMAALKRKDVDLKLALQEKDRLNEDLRNTKQILGDQTRALQDEQEKNRNLSEEISRLSEEVSKLTRQNHELQQNIQEEEKRQQAVRKQNQKTTRETLKYVKETQELSVLVNELEQERARIIQENQDRIDEALELRDELKEAQSQFVVLKQRYSQLELENQVLTDQVADSRAAEEENKVAHEIFLKEIEKSVQSMKDDISKYKIALETRDDELKEAKAMILQLKKENQQSESERRFVEIQAELNSVNDELAEALEFRVQVQKENAILRSEIRSLEENLKKQQKRLQAQYKEKENEIRASHFEGQVTMNKTKAAYIEYRSRVEELENEIISLKETNSKLEDGTFGLNEAMSKVRALQRELETSKKAISQRTKGYNNALSKIEKLHAEVVLLRNHLFKVDPDLKRTANMIGFQELPYEDEKSELNWIGQKDGFCLDISTFKVGTTMELEKAKAMTLQLEREVEALEVERLDMKSQLRLLALVNGERAAKLGLSAADIAKLDSFVEQLKSGEPVSLELASSEAESIQARKLTQRVSILEKELDEKQDELTKSQEAVSKLTEQIRAASDLHRSVEDLKGFIASTLRNQDRFFQGEMDEQEESQRNESGLTLSHEGTQTTPARLTANRSPIKGRGGALVGLGSDFFPASLTPNVLDQLAKALREGELADQANVSITIKAVKNLPPAIIKQIYVVASINRASIVTKNYSAPAPGSRQLSLHDEVHRLAVSNKRNDSILLELFEASEAGKQDRSNDRMIGRAEISIDSFGRAADKTWSGSIECWLALQDSEGKMLQGLSVSKQHRTEIQIHAKFLEAPSKRAQVLEEQLEAIKEISQMRSKNLENCEKDLAILRDDLKRKSEDLDRALTERDSLRKELQHSRLNSSLSLSRVLQFSAVGRVGSDGKFVKDSEGDVVDSSELMTLVTDLNAHLIEALDNLSKREEEVTALEAELHKYSEDMAVLRVQQVILYKEHTQRIGTLENEANKHLKEWTQAAERANLEAAKATAAMEKFATLSTLGSSEERKYAIDAERKLIVLESERDELLRASEALGQEQAELRENYDNLVLDMARQQHRLKQRIGRLDRGKAAAEKRLAQKQRQLDNSVSQERFSTLHQEHLLLKERYAILVNEGSKALLEQATIHGQRQKVEKLCREKEELELQLKEASDRSGALLSRLEMFSLKDGPSDRQQVAALSEKLVKLEVSERNFARRHELCLERLKGAEQERGRMEERISFLEQETVEKAAIIQRLQEAERSLQSRLERTISSDEANDLKALVERQGEEISELKANCLKFEEIAELATDQAKAMEELQGIHKDELESLRAFSMQVLAESENAAELGILHRKIFDRDRKIHELTSKISGLDRELARLDAYIVRLEEAQEKKEEDVCRVIDQHSNEKKRLQSMVDDLKILAAGQIPLDKADEWAASLRELTEHKEVALGEVATLRKAKIEAEQRVETLQIQVDDHRQLLGQIRQEQRQEAGAVNPLSAVTTIDKFASLSEELTKFKIENIRLARHVKQLQERESYLESSVEQSEGEIRRLEEALVHHGAQAERDARAQEAQAELIATLQQKLADLERNKATAVQESRDAERAGPVLVHGTESGATSLSDFEAIGAMRDKMIQLNQQLGDKQAEIDRLKLQLESAESVSATAASGDGSKLAVAAEHTQEVAKLTIDRLEKNIERKNGLIAKYQQQLRDAREEYMKNKELDANTIDGLREQLAAKINESIHQMRSKVQGSQPQMVLSGTTAAEADQIMEEKSRVIATLNEELRMIKERIESVEQERIREMDEAKRKLDAAEERCEKLQDDLKKASEEKPSKKIEALVQRLQLQLAEKENKQKEMKAAIESLKGEMMKAAELQSKSAIAQQQHQSDKVVQQLGETLTVDIEKLRSRLDKMKGEQARIKKELDEEREAKERFKKEFEEEKTAKTKLEGELLKANRDLKKAKQERKDAQDALKAIEEGALQDKKRIEEVERQVREADRGGTPKGAGRDGRGDADKERAMRRWETEKRLEAKVEDLREKLREQRKELDALERQHAADLEKAGREAERLRQQIERLEQDKKTLKAQLRGGEGVDSEDLLKRVREAERGHFEAQEQNEKLRRVVEVDEREKENVSRARQAVLERQVRELQGDKDSLTQQLERLSAEGAAALDQERAREVRRLDAEVLRLREREEELERELLAAQNQVLRLRFEDEHASLRLQRWRRRVRELESLPLAAGRAIAPDALPQRAKAGKEEEEMERFVRSTKVALEKLHKENEELRAKSSSNVQHMALVRENKAVKATLAERERELAALHEKVARLKEQADKRSKAEERCHSLERQLREEADRADGLADRLRERDRQVSRLEADVRAAREVGGARGGDGEAYSRMSAEVEAAEQGRRAAERRREEVETELSGVRRELSAALKRVADLESPAAHARSTAEAGDVRQLRAEVRIAARAGLCGRAVGAAWSLGEFGGLPCCAAP